MGFLHILVCVVKEENTVKEFLIQPCFEMVTEDRAGNRTFDGIVFTLITLSL